jgi:hypothetical protein
VCSFKRIRRIFAYRFRIDVKEFTKESEGEVAESTGGKEWRCDVRHGTDGELFY